MTKSPKTSKTHSPKLRDHLLFLGAGIMIGFVLSYLAYESIGADQPAPRRPGQTQAAAGPAAGATGNPQQPPERNPGPNTGSAFTREQVQQLSAYVAQNPDDAAAVLQLANMNFDAGNWQQAAELYERRVELQPGEADVLSDLGICYREMGELDQALETFDQAQEINPQHWESRFNEAVVLAIDMARYDDAEAVLDELRAIQPGNQNVERLAAEVQRRRNQA